MSPKPRALSFLAKKAGAIMEKNYVSSIGRALVKTRGYEFNSRT